LAAIGFPLYLSYARAQETDGAARTVVTALNEARQFAITRGISYTVETQTNPNNRMRLTCVVAAGSPCTTAVYVGPGTDGSGWRTLENASQMILVVGLLSLATMFPVGYRQITDAGRMTMAVTGARHILEDIGAVPFANIRFLDNFDTTSTATLPAADPQQAIARRWRYMLAGT